MTTTLVRASGFAVLFVVLNACAAGGGGCELYPTSCGYDEQAPPRESSCEGTVFVQTQRPCIDDSNKNNPPPSTVMRTDCKDTARVCTR